MHEGEKHLEKREVSQFSTSHKYLKYLRIGPHGLCALGLIALGVALRVAIIAQGWPLINSDEGTTGLMALHIAYHGETPVFFYGQGYMGSLEAFLAAPLFRLFGPSSLTLRLGLLLLYALFLLNLYLLTSMLYTRGFALFTLFLLSFGSVGILFLQLSATGGHPDMPFFGSLLVLYALVLARTASEKPLTRDRRWRVLAYAGWGLVAGLALWTDPLLIPFIGTSGWLLLRFCRYELQRPVVLCVLLSFLLPMVPVVLYNLNAPLDKSTLAVVGSAVWVQKGKLEIASPLVSVLGTLFVSLPRVTGGNVLCNVPVAYAWPLQAAAAPCTAVNGLWSGGFLLLLALAAVAAWAGYRALQKMARVQPWTEEQRHEAIGAFTRLMLIGSAALTLLLYAPSSPAGLDPWSAARYLVGLFIAAPVVLWPLWRASKRVKPIALTLGAGIVRYGLLCVIVLSFVLGWAQTLNLIPAAQRENQHDAVLIKDLLKMGVSHIYTDYWTCDKVAFESSERIICSVVDEQLQPGLNRYAPYMPIVAADPHAAWVFLPGSLQAHAFARKLAAHANSYLVSNRDGYVIYRPVV